MNENEYWKCIEPIWDEVSIYDGSEAFLSQIATVTARQKILFCGVWAFSEICNGGLHQFFSNSTGVLAPEAIEAFTKIGMPSTAEALTEATKFFGAEYLRDRENRNNILEKYENDHGEEDWDPFEKLDEKIYGLIDKENGGFSDAANNFCRNG